jgi:hypothetical protein
MAQLAEAKAHLEKQIAATLEHGDEGQHTYYEAGYKIKVTATKSYKIDKEEYEIMKGHIPVQFDPIKKFEKTTLVYDLDKGILREAFKYADSETLERLQTFISEKPGALKVDIGTPEKVRVE